MSGEEGARSPREGRAEAPCGGVSLRLANSPTATVSVGAPHSPAASLPTEAGTALSGQRVPRWRRAPGEEATPGSAPAHPRPTPWVVTATCSWADYSAIPHLGFPPDDEEGALGRALGPREAADEAAREQRWYAQCSGVPLLASASPSTILSLRRLARRPRQGGIPRSVRAVMWLTLTGMAVKLDENEYYCASLLRQHGFVTGRHAAAIAADLERTFPRHPYFSESDVGLYKLRNLLHALCWRSPLLNYCQSFNYLAGFLLLVFDDEERAFWMLIHILETLLPGDYFNETLLGARVDQAVFELLVERRLPKLARAVAEGGVRGFDVGAVLPPWAMSLYVNTFPVETTLRVWDYMFTESDDPMERTSAHLDVALAVLKRCEPALLACEDVGDAMLVLRRATETATDADALVATARSMATPAAELHALRWQVKPRVAEDTRQREEMRLAMREQRVAEALRRHSHREHANAPAHAGQGAEESGERQEVVGRRTPSP